MVYPLFKFCLKSIAWPPPLYFLLHINPLLDLQGQEVTGNDVTGSLCIKKPWPGIARTVYGNHPRFLQTYFTTYPGYFFAGDGAHRYVTSFLTFVHSHFQMCASMFLTRFLTFVRERR
jgi:hypothetical protein